MRDLVGVRGNVWVVGAQNAGKSTLINSMARCVGDKVSHLTEAPVPGTTLGIIRVEGILSGKAKLFDTPGILHPYQITTRLTPEEQKLAHMSKELKPRTYRIKVCEVNCILLSIYLMELKIRDRFIFDLLCSYSCCETLKKKKKRKHFGR